MAESDKQKVTNVVANEYQSTAVHIWAGSLTALCFSIYKAPIHMAHKNQVTLEHFRLSSTFFH